MEFDYDDLETLHTDDFKSGFEYWHHEGIGAIGPAPGGGMRLHCTGSRQGGEGCMAFFRPTLPDRIAYEYDLTVRSHGGLVINYLAIRGVSGEDMIEDSGKLEPRTGIMANYYAKKWGLQSYHVSISRFNDKGEHTGTCNWRRNPGSILMAHGVDLVREINRRYHIRIVKDSGHCQLYVDGCCVHGFVDRNTARGAIPASGKFGFRLIGSDVMADVENFAVFRVRENHKIWADHADFMG
jgi:hypothetical protein